VACFKAALSASDIGAAPAGVGINALLQTRTVATMPTENAVTN